MNEPTLPGQRLNVFAVVRTGPSRFWFQDLPFGELLVLTADDGSPWALSYLCPCGCGVPVMIPSPQAVAGQSPSWTLTAEPDGTYSASPSVRMTSPTGCQAHYHIRHNRIDWC